VEEVEEAKEQVVHELYLAVEGEEVQEQEQAIMIT
jgi:hypothetical protein